MSTTKKDEDKQGAEATPVEAPMVGTAQVFDPVIEDQRLRAKCLELAMARKGAADSRRLEEIADDYYGWCTTGRWAPRSVDPNKAVKHSAASAEEQEKAA